MSLFARRALGDSQNQLIPSRYGRRYGSVYVTPDAALRSSVVWAALRLRADLISTMPLDVYRQIGDLHVNVATPPVLTNPGGDYVDIHEWLWSTQFELDRVGNAFGIISDRDAFSKPRRIDLVQSDSVTVKQDKTTGVVTYIINKKTYDRADIWHERQFTLPGLIMGMSPISYAASAIAQFQSAVEFGLDWFANGASVPTGHLRNTTKTLQPDVADTIKRRFKSAIEGRDIFVTGNDWEFNTQSVQANESQFLETQHISNEDIARYFGVPGDLVDVQSGTKSAVTYASITQRNLQFLIMNLGPAFVRRETALSTLVSAPRYVKFNTDALLRMDPDTRNSMMVAQVVGKIRTPSEVRALDNLSPFTDTQIGELETLGIIGESPDEVVADLPIADGGTE